MRFALGIRFLVVHTMPMLLRYHHKSLPEFEAFYAQYMQQLYRKLEDRRQRYWKYIKIRALIFLIVMLVLPFIGVWIAQWLNYVLNLLNAWMGLGMADSPVTGMALSIMFPLLLAMYTIMPIFRYRRHLRNYKATLAGHEGESWEKITLKELMFKEIFSVFGDFSFQREGMNSSLNFFNPMILPDYDKYLAEDRIAGVFEGVHLDICEGQFIKNVEGRQSCVFRGLLIAVDFSHKHAKLRTGFKGETAVILHERLTISKVRERFKDFTKITLPTQALEERYDAFTTHPNEGKYLVSREVLETLAELREIILATTEQVTHFDDKVIDWLRRIFRPGKQLMLKDLDIYYGAEGINGGVQCSFYDNKMQVSIPYHHDLFEPNSIFEPAMHEEDVRLVYNIMHMLGQVIRAVEKAKQEPV